MANLNTALTPAPVITVFNKDGSTATGYTGNVTMTLGTNPTNATLGGTLTVAASSGVATFTDLTLNRSGKDFTLRATAAEQGGYTPKARVSRPFTIATKLVFTTQPVSVENAGDILPLFTVTAQDSLGATDTNYTGEVTVALYTGASLGILSGLYTRTAIAGVADFSGLSIDAEGLYSLRATGTEVSTAYAPAPVISNSFVVGHALVAALTSNSPPPQLFYGYESVGPIGSITPSTYLGVTFLRLFSGLNRFSINQTVIAFDGTGLGQGFFTTLSINGGTLTSASASFTDNGSTCTWSWSGTALFDEAGTYAILFT